MTTLSDAGAALRELETDALRESLLHWFDRNRRDLPWRYAAGEVPDPYRVWLSEVMLQQTRVETVRGYYERWVQRFPTLADLAAAELDDVLKAWEGLGYYSRARNFHRAVREVRQRHEGVVPSDALSFRALPGVGEYTAGAVMSIAFAQREPAVDGNVRRVAARLLDDPEPSHAKVRELAARLVAGPRPGDINQALMELGATICVPRKPRCGECPIRAHCAAFVAGTQLDRPRRRPKAAIPHEQHGVAIIRNGGKVVVRRRPEGGRLGGMWEFPGSRCGPGEASSEAAARVARDYVELPLAAPAPVGRVVHIFSHVRVTYDVFEIEREARPAVGPETASEIRWLDGDGLASIALPRAQQKIARLANLYPFTPAS